MNSLIEDLQTPKENLIDFAEVTKRVLDYLPNVVSVRKEVRGYVILSSSIAGTIKYARPINNRLFIFHAEEFVDQFQKFLETLKEVRNRNHRFDVDAYETMDRVVYSIQQSIGVGFDFLGNPNSARKHVGNRFEELIRLIISNLGVPNKKVVFKIPYPTDERALPLSAQSKRQTDSRFQEGHNHGFLCHCALVSVADLAGCDPAPGFVISHRRSRRELSQEDSSKSR